MEKNKLVKIVSIITGTAMIGFIVSYIIENNWSQVISLSCLFFGLWIMPAFLKKINKKK